MKKRNIPKKTDYCYRVKIYTSSNKSKKYRKINPCKYHCYKYNKNYDDELEYCRYLKDFLQIQDRVKDCGINLD